jgi:hypothetical protein
MAIFPSYVPITVNYSKAEGMTHVGNPSTWKGEQGGLWVQWHMGYITDSLKRQRKN